jgi:hypothetical protein
MEVKEGNEVIASILEMRQGKIVPTEASRDLIEKFMDLVKPLPFLIGWDELIPVVEKIESQQRRTAILFSNTYKHICTISERDHTLLVQKDGDTKIEAVYKAVLEFINWYNSIKKA